MVLGQFPGSIDSKVQPLLSDWLNLAWLVEEAHRFGIAWLRSRLPGYPNLPVPHLVSGSPVATDEFSLRLVWRQGERSLGLQTTPAPPVDRVARPLGLSTAEASALSNDYRRLAAAFGDSPEWQRLSVARADCDDEARERLRAANKLLKAQLTTAVVDAFEPAKAYARHGYRVQTLDDAVAALTGPEAEYVHAFDAADRLIELAASDVFGQLVAFGPPPVREVGADIEIATDDLGCRWVSCSAPPGDTLWDVGLLTWLGDPIVSDAVLVEGVSFASNRVDGSSISMNCRILAETSGGLSAP